MSGRHRLRRPGAPFLAGAPLLIAHRGGAALAPENTLEAFRRALQLWSADMLELDVQPSREGEAVVFHDATLDRTTDGSGRVADHTLEELRSLDAGYRFRDHQGEFPFRARGLRIPTLHEVLDAFPHTRITIEIKDGRVQPAVMKAVQKANAVGRTLIAAGRTRNRAFFRNHPGPISASGQELRRFYVAHRLGLAARLPLAVDALQMPERHGGRQVLTPDLVREAQARNLAVHIWTVDQEDDMHRLLEWGVDGIITDRPDRLARVLHERVGRPLPPGV